MDVVGLVLELLGQPRADVRLAPQGRTSAGGADQREVDPGLAELGTDLLVLDLFRLSRRPASRQRRASQRCADGMSLMDATGQWSRISRSVKAL